MAARAANLAAATFPRVPLASVEPRGACVLIFAGGHLRGAAALICQGGSVQMAPASIGIATYAVRIRAKRRAGEYEPLGAVGDQALSIRHLVSEFLETVKASDTVDDEAKVVLRATRVETDQDSCWGLLRSGDFGFAAEGINIKTRAQSYRRDPDDAETIPFYFRCYLPSESDIGLLLIQRHGPRGVFSAFTRQLRDYIAKWLPEHVLVINRLVPSEVIKDLMEGDIRAIQVIAHVLPKDFANKLRFLGNENEVGTYIIEAKAKRNRFLQVPGWLKKLREGRVTVVELPSELVGSDARVRLRVTYEGTTRTIDMSRPEDIAPYIDATSDLEIVGGHPVFTSVDAYCNGLLEQLLKQLGKRS